MHLSQRAITPCLGCPQTSASGRSDTGTRLGMATAVLVVVASICLSMSGRASADLFLTEGQPFSGQLGTLTLYCSWGGDPSESTYPQCPGPATEAAVVNWGDGTGPDGTAVATLGSCGFDTCSYAVTGAHTFRTAGQHDISYSVTYDYLDASIEDAQDTETGSVAAHVADAPLTLQPESGVVASVGTSPSLALATLQDGNPDATSSSYSVSINWGDGAASQAGTATPTGAPGGFIITGSHAYARAGIYTATETVDDSGGSTSSTHTTVTVTPAQLTASATSELAATADASTGQVQVATLSDTNPLAHAGDLHATIDWGDGTPTSTAAVTAATAGLFAISGTHIYATSGTFQIAVSVDDGDGGHASTRAMIVVGNAHDLICASPAAALHAGEGSPLPSTVLATFADADQNLTTNAFTTTIDWGDGSPPTTGTVARSSGQALGCAGPLFTASGGHTYIEAGQYTATLTIADQGGATATVATTIAVADQPLTASGSPGLELNHGHPSGTITVAQFRDANPTGHVTDFRATINWGDGTPATTGTIVATATGAFAVTGAHTYTTTSAYHINTAISDVGGATVAAQTTAIVNAVPLTATIRQGFRTTLYRPYYTAIATLSITGAPDGATIIIRCHGRSCPLARRALQATNHPANLARQFRGKHLAPGTRVTVALADPGWCGEFWAYTIRAKKLPAYNVNPTILGPGTTTPPSKC
jgi:large repetitive protein